MQFRPIAEVEKSIQAADTTAFKIANYLFFNYLNKKSFYPIRVIKIRFCESGCKGTEK